MGSGIRRVSGLVLAAVILCLSSWARAEDAPVPEEARSHFKVGLEYLNDPAGPRYEDALREFSAAHAAAPSSWKTLNNIGLCALNLERDQEAVDAYEQALALAGSAADSEWRDSVQRDIATLKAGLVRVTIRVQPASAMLLDERLPTSGKSVLNRYTSPTGLFELGIHAGHHRISAILGGRTDVWEFDAKGGAALSHAFRLEPGQPAGSAQGQAPTSGVPVPVPATTERPSTAPSERHPRASVYVGLIATGALAAGAGVAGVLAVGKHAEFNEKNGHAPISQTDDTKQSGKQLAVVTDVLILAAILAAAGTSYLYFSQPKEPPNPSQIASVAVRPSVGPGSGWVTVSGRF